MRFYEGDHAYEIERIVNRETQLETGWRYNVYRIRPVEELLRSGQAKSKEQAEEAGQRELREVIKQERRAEAKKKHAA